MGRHRDYSRLFIFLGLLAGIVAVAPIVAAVMGIGSSVTIPKTAFASAPAGEYAVITRSEGAADVVAVAWLNNPGAVTEIARVPRVEGFPSAGAVSPDGKFVALTSVEGGTASNPVASIMVLSLESGVITRVATDAQPGEAPVWSPDSSAVTFARDVSRAESAGVFSIARVGRDGEDESTVQEFRSVFGVYPVGNDVSGRVVTAVLDGKGSWLYRPGLDPVAISTNLTRDWELSPDGRTVAFIEVTTVAGVGYRARTVSLDGSAAAAQALEADVSALGTAWNPATSAPAFGLEPVGADGVTVQALSAEGPGASGFDVPLQYSASGDGLAVTHWSGRSFQESGTPELQLISAAGRSSFEGYTRFLGWSVR